MYAETTSRLFTYVVIRADGIEIEHTAVQAENINCMGRIPIGKLTSCLFCFYSAALLMLSYLSLASLVKSKPVKQEVSRTHYGKQIAVLGF